MDNLKILDVCRECLPSLPKRPDRSHKGTFGRLLCVCGSEGMAGAAFFSAAAAYRTGAGLVEILTCRENVSALQILIPEAIVTAYDADEPDAYVIRDCISRADAIVIGCGLGRSRTAAKILGAVLRGAQCPILLDADALNIISERRALLSLAKGAVITPHAGEMSRLAGIGTEDILASPASICHAFAREHSLICLLKDHKTAISCGDGEVYLNVTGNSGMSTGGSGDVLAGIIGALLAQRNHIGASNAELVRLGAYLHGLAGDLASNELGEYSLTASDIIRFLHEAIKHYSI